MQFVKRNTSDEVADLIRTMILDGALADGARINEVHLAQELGVSRTPLREALARLAAEGATISRPHHGVHVSPLTEAEFSQVYQIRPILDPEALRLAGIPEPHRLEELSEINEAISRELDPAKVVALDDHWHRTLLAHCSNKVLLSLIEQMMLRTRRYEIALFRETDSVLQTSNEHLEIIRALEDGDLRAACKMLKQNMQTGFEPIRSWLADRDKARKAI